MNDKTQMDTADVDEVFRIDTAGEVFTFRAVDAALALQSHVSFWRRLWVVVRGVPRYLFTGSVELP